MKCVKEYKHAYRRLSRQRLRQRYSPRASTMSSWWYVPVCIRFLSGEETHCLSGINLVLQDDAGNVYEDYTITINHIPIPRLQDFQMLVSTNDLIDDSNVKWYPASYHHHIPLFDARSDVYDFVSYLKNHGFRLIPNDLTEPSLLANINLLGVSMAQPFHRLVDSYRRMDFVPATKLDAITVELFPFNFTNPILFSSYQAHGHINYEVAGSNAYLSDIKYLENMAGGIVHAKAGSVGLVLGNAKKMNGDGDLMVILAWLFILPMLLKYLNRSIFVNKLLAGFSTRTVMPVMISGLSVYWGSCICYAPDTLITNHHVIKTFVEEEGAKATIFISPSESIVLHHGEDVITTPFTKIDLSFIKLSARNQHTLSRAGISPVQKAAGCNIGDKVTTVGYGLFFHPQHVTPIESTGHVSTMLRLPYYITDREEKPVIIITSASCWNGSSGGALFDSRGHLLGIICSNATVKLPAFDEREQQLEKLPKFSLVLPIDLVNECYHHPTKVRTLNHKINMTWNLDAYHRDITVETAKL